MFLKSDFIAFQRKVALLEAEQLILIDEIDCELYEIEQEWEWPRDTPPHHSVPFETRDRHSALAGMRSKLTDINIRNPHRCI